MDKKLLGKIRTVGETTCAAYVLGEMIDSSPVKFYGGFTRMITRPPFHTQLIAVRNLTSHISSDYVDARSIMALLNLEGRAGSVFEFQVGSVGPSAESLLTKISEYFQTGKI